MNVWTDGWGGNHLEDCDTLCEMHLQLFDAETDILIKIGQMAAAAVKKLDRMVENGNRHQMVRSVRFKLIQQRPRPWSEQVKLWEQYVKERPFLVGPFEGSSQHERPLALDFYAPYMIQGNKIVLPETNA